MKADKALVHYQNALWRAAEIIEWDPLEEKIKASWMELSEAYSEWLSAVTPGVPQTPQS